MTASSTQVPIATSSGEAEFYAAAKTASRLIGVGRLLADMSYTLGLQLMVDSSSAKGTLAWRGTGKIKHLEVQTCWVQKATQDGTIMVGNVLGTQNPADLAPKYLNQADMKKCLDMMGCATVSASR
jgi:hypothetical protein